MKRHLINILVLVMVCCALMFLLEKETNLLKNLYNDYALDNYDHWLPCEKLPMVAVVEQVLNEHQPIVEKIKQVNPGFVFIEMDTFTCPGKADIIISYASHQDRDRIEALIGGRDFFGIPFRLRNQ